MWALETRKQCFYERVYRTWCNFVYYQRRKTTKPKKLCDAFNVEVEIINHRDEQKYEEEITEDIIAIMTSYSARIYGKRGGRKEKKV